MAQPDTQLRAGFAKAEITPAIPTDLVGWARRWQPAVDVHSPLEAQALVLRQGDTSVAIVTADVLGFQEPWASNTRSRIAAAVDTDVDRVLLHGTHTHAGPQPPFIAKIGGNQRELSDAEKLYIEYLPWKLEAVARVAARRLQPVRVAWGQGAVDLGVNRRERTPEGKAILGWNPDAACDREVVVLRLDDLSDRPQVFLVNYACHPVVVGPDVPAVSTDFIGPLRNFVTRVSGAECMFLLGAAGNVLPLECCFDYLGPEVAFGERVGLEALHAVADARTRPSEIVRLPYASATPITLYRRRALNSHRPQPLAGITETVHLPLLPLPSVAEHAQTVAELVRNYERAKASGAGPEILNSLEYHVLGAQRAQKELEGPAPRTEVPATIQAFRIGDGAITSVPGEAFSEIALAVKTRSAAPVTMFAGYSNALVSYLPAAAEYSFGGYECTYANRSYGLPAQVAPESEALIVAACTRLIGRLFASET